MLQRRIFIPVHSGKKLYTASKATLNSIYKTSMKGRKGFQREKEERKIKDPGKFDPLPVKSNGWKTKDGH